MSVNSRMSSMSPRLVAAIREWRPGPTPSSLAEDIPAKSPEVSADSMIFKESPSAGIDVLSSTTPMLRPIILTKRQLKAPYPTTKGHGARRNDGANEILMRGRDGRLYALRCPFCDQGKPSTQQGLSKHIQACHNVPVKTLAEVFDHCRIHVTGELTQVPSQDVTEWTLTQHEESPRGTSIRGSKECQMLPVQVNTEEDNLEDDNSPRKPTVYLGTRSRSAPSTGKLTTKQRQDPKNKRSSRGQRRQPPILQSRASASSPIRSTTRRRDLREPQFQFCNNGGESRQVRVRPVSVVTSVQKLFAHAVAGGTAQPRTMLLVVYIQSDNPIPVVKDDDDDFRQVQNAMKDMDKSPTAAQRSIMVMAAD